jgi:hypothetical protein
MQEDGTTHAAWAPSLSAEMGIAPLEETDEVNNDQTGAENRTLSAEET